MKYLPLILAGIGRHRVRAALIAAQIVFVFLLFGVLQGLDASMTAAIRHTHAERMFVGSKLGSADLLPVSLWPQLQKVPGIARVTFESQLPCTHGGPRDSVWALGIDPESYFAVYYENRTSGAELEALQRDRAGALVGAALAHRLGWRVGQHVTLQCYVPQRSGSANWEFDIVGEFQQVERPEFSDIMLINYAYLNEARAINRDRVNVYGLTVRNPADVADIGKTVDSLFANSSHPTNTDTEAEAARANFRWVGDVGFLARSVSMAAFLALMVAVGTLAMQSVRERGRDLAVLKVVGFTELQVHLLVLAESTMLWITSAIVGLGAAALVLPRAQHLVGQGVVPLTIVGFGLLCAVICGWVSAFLPAWHASHIELADALSDR